MTSDLRLVRLRTMLERGPTAPASKQDRDEELADTDQAVDFERVRARSAARRALFGDDAAQPTMIGRYRIDSRLGEGGMGEVFGGVDLELERRVAVKLVLPHLSRMQGPQRLRREARALARLSHPNVVQVYEVGEHMGRTFLAMELVQGGTLTDWLGAESRGWKAVLERFVAAGRGLAAAHAAGITHRDFKPDNVLLTREGRVRVADFGLASTGDPNAESTEHDPGQSPAYSDDRLSAIGTVLGTLRYMPLEQLRGEPVDARADQFAFCVALYEGLWGELPFPLTNPFEHIDTLENNEATVPPRGGVPRSLWRVIRRGLASDAQRRWPDMPSLLVALESIVRRRRWIAVGGVTAPLAGLLIFLGRASSGDDVPTPVDPCIEVRGALDTVWGEASAQQLGRAFEATGLPFAQASAQATHAGLDDWSGRWLDEREQLCRATASAAAPAEVLGLRGACLAHQRERFEAGVGVLLDADADTVTRAQDQLVHLPEPRDCSDDEHLLLGVRPVPAAKAEPAAELRRVLAGSQAQRLSGHVAEAERLVTPALAAAQELDYRPLVAEALTEVGEVAIDLGERERGIERLERAVDLAEASHHDHLAARIWLDLASQTATELRDASRGRSQLRRAESANERIGVAPLARSRLEFLRGKLAELEGDLEQAESALRAALVSLEQSTNGAARLVRPAYLSHLAKVVAELERADEGLALRERALAAAEAGFGPDHPEVAGYAFSLGQAMQAAGRDAEASAQLERAAESWLGGPGTPDPALGTALLSLTHVAITAEELDKASRHAHDAQRVLARSLPRDHQRHGDASMTLAVVADLQGDHEAALRAYGEAAEHYERSLGGQARILDDVRVNAGVALLELDRIDEARERFAAALSSGHSGAHVPVARFGLAIIELHDGDPTAARVQLRAIVPVLDDFEPGERLEYELLDQVTRMRHTGRDVRLSAELLAIVRDSTHELHEHMQWVAGLITLTQAEQRQLGI